MDLFDTCTWAYFIIETTFLDTWTIHFPRSNIVFFKTWQIHSKEIGLLLETNFDKGGMEALVEELSKDQASVKVKRTSYWIGLVRDCEGVSIDLPGQSSTLWSSTMKLAESKELIKEKLHLASNSIY
jgi:hypothetical protein